MCVCLCVHLDSDDMAGFLEAHLEHLSTGTASDLTLVDQISHLRRVTLKRPVTDYIRLSRLHILWPIN